MVEQASNTTTGTGLLLVISGPSGVGKTSIVREVERRLGGSFSVSATTRPRSASEVDGRDYFFVTEERFDAMLAGGEFLEHAQVFGKHRYGTPRGPVDDGLRHGRLIILEIDVQGALQVHAAMPEALMIFILPPSDEELLRRLRDRAREDEDRIQRRYAEARQEIQLARASAAYDHMIVNDDLPRAIEETCRIITRRQAERRGG
jgi:guanylate kinase